MIIDQDFACGAGYLQSRKLAGILGDHAE